MKTWDERRRFIIRYLSENRGHVDVLNAAFVDCYLEATSSKFYPMPYGAHKCPQLGRDLSRMEREGTLSRKRTGISGMRGQGFPAWVWCYELGHIF